MCNLPLETWFCKDDDKETRRTFQNASIKTVHFNLNSCIVPFKKDVIDLEMEERWSLHIINRMPTYPNFHNKLRGLYQHRVFYQQRYHNMSRMPWHFNSQANR